VGLNGGLAVVKLVTGIVGQSYALIADAIESLGDIFSSAIVWGGLVIASRPADENHPYGHGKAEPLAALAVAAMLIIAGLGIATQAIHEIRSTQDAPAGYTLLVLLAVVGIKEGMYRYESRTAIRIGSTAVHVDAWHHRSDALTSAAAAVGISIALIGGKGYESADDWAALAACTIIVFNGIRFARTGVAELMDVQPDRALADEIQAMASRVEGARYVEKVLVRKMGPDLYVDLHLEVDPSLSVQRAHDIAHAVKDIIKSGQKRVADVLVHVEPHVERG
jgi:cation diffusion facilitator family transporter